MPLRSLKSRSILMVTILYAVVGVLTLGAFLLVARDIVESFGRRFAEKHAVLDKNRILAPIQREVALARKLADAPALKAWLRNEADPSARILALSELESYRRFFTDGSYFFVHGASRNYYFNNAQGDFTGHERRYTLDPADPTMAWYFSTMQDLDDFALHVDSSEQLGLVKVWINVMVKDGGRKVGLGGTGLDLTDFLKAIVQTGEKGIQTILVNGQGTIQAHPDSALMDTNARMKDESKRITLQQLLDRDADRLLLTNRMARLKADPSRVETFYLTVQGRRHLVAATAIKDIDWITLVLVDPSQVVSLRAFAPIAAILILSLIVTIVLVSALLNRLILRPLGKLTASAREIASGRYQIELPTERQDEIGDLTRAFSHMTAMVRDDTATLETKVKDRTEALSEANHKLVESNRKIMDSLEVAQLLQSSLLPTPTLLQAQLPDHFTLYKPRDFVGGDFYALFPDPDGFLLAMADCTGHGVPGALMTMSARSVLEQLLGEHGPEDPSRLLQEMNRAMKTTLNRESDRDALDNGLELALLRVSRPEGRFRFASAHIPLLIHHANGTWEELPGDRQSLGYRRSTPDFPFKTAERHLQAGDTYFLSTDGLLDQAGGPHGFGLGRTRLQELLNSQISRPLIEQGACLAQALADYQGDCPQRDDITLLGFRLEPPPTEEHSHADPL